MAANAGLGSLKAQTIKPRTVQITEMESLQLTRNLLRIAVFNICYMRGLFPANYFEDRYLAALDMKIKKLMPMDLESRRLIDWMEKGVYDALQKRFLETLFFRLCHAEDGPLIEEYAFSFSYNSASHVQTSEVSMNIAQSNAYRQQGKTLGTNSEDLTPSQMKNTASKMVRTLVELMRTLINVPGAKRTVTMQLHYRDDVTPTDYEPPYFRSSTYDEDNSWPRTPLKMKVGDVNSKHYAISLKVRSILDPCEDENDINDRKKTVAVEVPSESGPKRGTDDFSDARDSACAYPHGNSRPRLSRLCYDRLGHTSPTPARPSTSPGSQHEGTGNSTITAAGALMQVPVHDLNQKRKMEEDRDPDDITQDSEYEGGNVILLKDWALAYDHNDNIDMSTVIRSFPGISVIHIKDIVRHLVEEGFFEVVARDIYRVAPKRQKITYHTCTFVSLLLNSVPRALRQDRDRLLSHAQDRGGDTDARLYKKALQLVLPMEYISIPQLQSKLGGEVKSTWTVRKLISRMAGEGYIEASASYRRLGRRVLRKRGDDELLEVPSRKHVKVK